MRDDEVGVREQQLQRLAAPHPDPLPAKVMGRGNDSKRCPWINRRGSDAAWAELGVPKARACGDDPRVVAYYREAGHGEIGHDEVPWCAAFRGAMLRRAGAAGPDSLLARSYLNWGEAISEGRLGAIAVLTRGADPNAGHVGFLVGATKNKIYLLGGNQDDAVSVAAFDASRVLAYRWPELRGTGTPGGGAGIETNVMVPLTSRPMTDLQTRFSTFSRWRAGSPTILTIPAGRPTAALHLPSMRASKAKASTRPHARGWSRS